jgi:PAS domain S-box-containing protein
MGCNANADKGIMRSHETAMLPLKSFIQEIMRQKTLPNELGQLRRKVDELEKKNEQLRKDLQQSEERFFQLFYASSNPMAITTVEEGLIIEANQAYVCFSGYKCEELIGHTTIERGLWTDPKQRDMAVQRLREEGEVHGLEVSELTKTGDIRTVVFSADTITVKDEPCLLSMAIDITEQKKVAEALRESEESYRMLVSLNID